MSQFKHTIAVLLSIGLAYIWLSTPSLSYYSLQAFSVASFGFFLSKRFSKAQLWHILPETHSFEIVFVSFALTVLIGSTGNASSIFYPFAYIHLFFLVMTTRQITAISATLSVMLVHYALEPSLTSITIASFTTLPLMLVFFLFARRQYDDARLQHKIVEADELELASITKKEHSLESFLKEFLQPKLNVLIDLLETAIHRNEPVDPQILETQITLISSESEKIIEKTQKITS
jgi:hypothetical protein